MASKEIPWTQGGGRIVCTFTGAGDAPLSFSSDPNPGLDRVQDVDVCTTDGSVSVSVNVRQTGQRHEFLAKASQGSEAFVTADGQLFAVLKD